MSAISWKHAVNGYWGTAADWSSGTVPGASDDVTIALSGTFGVTIAAAAKAHSLTLNSAHAFVADDSALTIGVIPSPAYRPASRRSARLPV